ncbi:hypothetical protein KW797_04730 [Candidatus Parcubacteria bacterium]|nr:hypothetical protein [Candidatus Parcubacteria bacterium]
MKIVYEKPPIFERVAKQFDIRGLPVVFAWGDILYNPFRAGIPDDLIAHEETHSRQQSLVGGPEIWWERYLADAKFRLEQEIEAYREQYRFYCGGEKDRNKRFNFLNKKAGELASPIYQVKISRKEAMEKISMV